MMKLMTKADKLLIGLILLLSITGIFTIPALLSSKGEGKEVVIHIDGQEITRFPLKNTETSEFIEIPFDFNNDQYTARFEMKDGRVMLHRLSEEISPLTIHTDMGWISESYQMIICLPIRMYVTIESEGSMDDDLVDVIVN